MTSPAPSTAPVAAATPAAARRATTTAAKPAAKKNCNPPFNIGKDGIKHFKPECF
jgi:hypothetical protein